MSKMAPTDISQFRLVRVDWIDSQGKDGWNSLSSIKERCSLQCFSAGWLVSEDADSVVIVPHFGHECGMGDLRIPKVSITSMIDIAKPPEMTAEAKAEQEFAKGFNDPAFDTPPVDGQGPRTRNDEFWCYLCCKKDPSHQNPVRSPPAGFDQCGSCGKPCVY